MLLPHHPLIFFAETYPFTWREKGPKYLPILAVTASLFLLLSLLTSNPVAQGGLPGEGGTSGLQFWLQPSHEAQCRTSSGIVEIAVNMVVDAEKQCICLIGSLPSTAVIAVQ